MKKFTKAAACSTCSLWDDTESVCGLAAWLVPALPSSNGRTVQLKPSGPVSVICWAM